MKSVLTKEEYESINGYFNACNYVSAASLYLRDNALLRRPLTFDDIKPKLVGHWGSAPGQNFIYAHCDRVIKKYDLNMMYIIGPGHAVQSVMTNTYFDDYNTLNPNNKIIAPKGVCYCLAVKKIFNYI